ncbi:MAG TPA: hypothetical protein PLC99_13445 [Verrucomicrobiota bacterium]|nr:hypothetical protein [Verrucomicrobiota bacterium]
MSSFTIGSKTFAKPEIKQITGKPCLGFHRLNIRIAFQITEYPNEDKPMVLNLGGELKLKNQGNDHVIGKMTPSRGDRILKPANHSTEASCDFEVDLEGRSLEAIEALRNGGEIYLVATIWGTALLKENGAQQLYQDLHHNINQGTWVEILAQLGYAKYMLLEVPLPEKNTHPELAQAAEHLSSAQKAMMNGNYKDSMSACREVLEQLHKAMGDTELVAKEWKELLDKTRVLLKEDRIRLVRRALYILTSAAHHSDDTTAKFEWTREDARSTITILATMLQWLGSTK